MRHVAAAITLAGALLLAGCGGGDPAVTPTTRRPATTTSTDAPAAAGRRVEYQPGASLTLLEPGPCPGRSRPAMVALTHGLADNFAARGYVGVVVDARIPRHDSRFDARTVRAVGSAVHDLAIAVQWLRAHAAERCIDPNAIAATGHSFGAIVALALAYSEGEDPLPVITIDELGQPVTVEPAEHGPAPPELASYSNDVNAVVAFSGFALAAHIDPGEPPAILFHGRNDASIPFSLAEQTCAAATAAGVTCELVPHDAGHAAAPDLSAALDRAERFLDRAMLAPARLAGER